MDFFTLFFRVVWFIEQPCFSQMMHSFKICGILKCDKTANPPCKWKIDLLSIGPKCILKNLIPNLL